MIVRLPSSYLQHRASTGRLSSGVDSDSDPEKGRKKHLQMQNIPPRLRDIFVAPPGYLMVGGDHQAIEWCLFCWVGATLCHSQFHRELLERFMRDELDPHQHLARTFYQKPEVSLKERKTAKPYTYGLLYMGSPDGVADDQGHPHEMGRRMGVAHKIAFRPKPVWDTLLMRAKRLKYVQTPLGFRRYFWGYEPKATEIIATEIQGTAGDLHKWLLLDIAKGLKPKWELLTVGHDSDVLLVPESEAGDAAIWLKARLEQPIPFLNNQPFKAEIKVGPNWRTV